MASRFDLSEMSDELFIQRLILGQASRSWSLGEIAELEVRGFEILENFPELRSEIENRRNELVETATSALMNYKKNYEVIAASLPRYEILSNSLHTITGPMSEMVANAPSNESSIGAVVLNAAFENSLKQLVASSKATEDSLKRDKVFWFIFLATAISALCTCVSLMLTIFRF
jgi:hypothetical protein